MHSSVSASGIDQASTALVPDLPTTNSDEVGLAVDNPEDEATFTGNMYSPKPSGKFEQMYCPEIEDDEDDEAYGDLIDEKNP